MTGVTQEIADRKRGGTINAGNPALTDAQEDTLRRALATIPKFPAKSDKHVVGEAVPVTASGLGMTAAFDAACAGAITRERAGAYGHPLDNFRRIAALQAVVAECKDPEIKVALDALCTKIARLIETPDHLDSWVDVMGYGRTGVMIHDERARRASVQAELPL